MTMRLNSKRRASNASAGSMSSRSSGGSTAGGSDGSPRPEKVSKTVLRAARALAEGAETGQIDPQLDLAFFVDPPVPLVETGWYTCLFSVVVVANMAVIGAEVDKGCLSCDFEERGIFVVSDAIFAVLFIVDMIVAQVSYMSPEMQQSMNAGSGRNQINLFYVVDLCVVLSRMLYLALSIFGIQYPPLKMVSMLRIWHLSALAAYLSKHGGKGMRDLWMILCGLGDTFKTVSWITSILLLLMWALACWLTTWVGQSERLPHVYYADFEGANTWTALDYWGTVPRSCLSLLQVLTLDRWSTNVMWPIIRTFPWTALITGIFLLVGVLSLMSVIVGNIVERALKAAEKSSAEEHVQRERLDATVLNSLKSLFEEADEDGNGDGSLSIDELRNMLKLQHVKDRLALLKLPPRELESLFQLLAVDGDIPTDHFFRGVSRFRGVAKAGDLYQLSVDINRNMQSFQGSENLVKEVNRNLLRLLDLVDEADRDIIKGIDDHKDPVLQSRRNRVRNRRNDAQRQGLSGLEKEYMSTVKPRDRRPSILERKKNTLLIQSGLGPEAFEQAGKRKKAEKDLERKRTMQSEATRGFEEEGNG
eukprot:TRINITY_DN92151_c0_g1_i1.p1 TRINITY_DN92151_c0_g1~~TRINITY_DN92151_c0_g1_i1.p1  ORF type:complete len:590 (+),score=128.28 TRINITY_DN92151_c0_g1_i1:92-1861(+)